MHLASRIGEGRIGNARRRNNLKPAKNSGSRTESSRRRTTGEHSRGARLPTEIAGLKMTAGRLPHRGPSLRRAATKQTGADQTRHDLISNGNLNVAGHSSEKTNGSGPSNDVPISSARRTVGEPPKGGLTSSVRFKIGARVNCGKAGGKMTGPTEIGGRTETIQAIGGEASIRFITGVSKGAFRYAVEMHTGRMRDGSRSNTSDGFVRQGERTTEGASLINKGIMTGSYGTAGGLHRRGTLTVWSMTIATTGEADTTTRAVTALKCLDRRSVSVTRKDSEPARPICMMDGVIV